MELSEENARKVIAERIAPVLAVDGGEVELLAVDAKAGTVRLSLRGRYRGCPSRQYVFDYVVEPTLRRVLAGVKKIELV